MPVLVFFARSDDNTGSLKVNKYCSVCKLRKKCLRSPASKVRQATKIDVGIRHKQKSAVQQMVERFDTLRGRFFYSRKMGTVEPVFGNIRHTLGMDHFTLRGREKVDTHMEVILSGA